MVVVVVTLAMVTTRAELQQLFPCCLYCNAGGPWLSPTLCPLPSQGTTGGTTFVPGHQGLHIQLPGWLCWLRALRGMCECCYMRWNPAAIW